MSHERANWRLPALTALLLAAGACAENTGGRAQGLDTATAQRADEGAALEGEGGAGILQADIPILNVAIGDFFIEIDDRNGTATGNRDANLCSDGPNATGGSVLAQPSGPGTACPDPLTGEGGVAADNPNFPGPDPNNPDILGTDESLYVDWASLDPAVHLDPFEDSNTQGQDDILSPDSCLKANGNVPSKSNFTTTGFAANDTYLYMLQKRLAHQGNEEYHFYFTSLAPTLETVGSCEQWLWDLRNGDVEVTISYPSTAGLPQAQVRVQTWNGGAVDNQNGEALVQGTGWVDNTNPNLVHVALNINGNDKKAESTEDIEFDFDGTALASGIVTELALNIDAVFGGGCGLRQFVAGISTASSGRNDSLKDFLSPRFIETGDIDASLELIGSCEPGESQNFERFDYEVGLELDNGTAVPLPNADIDVFIDYKCGDSTAFTTIQDDDGTGCVGPSGSGCEGVIDTSSFPATCTVKARVVGTGGNFATGCSSEDQQSTTVFEELDVTLGAGAADVCPVDSADILDSFPFNLQIQGGSGEYSIVWGATGDAENNTCASTTSITDADADHTLNCTFDLDNDLSCAEGSVTATVSDDLCGTDVGPKAIAASRIIERTVQAGCAVDADCASDESCENGFCLQP